MHWILIAVAGCLEVVWALAMKASYGFTRFWPSLLTVVTIAASLSMLAVAMRSIPVGTAYLVWAGIGAIGTFAAGVVFFGESASATRIFASMLVLGGMVLMKTSS